MAGLSEIVKIEFVISKESIKAIEDFAKDMQKVVEKYRRKLRSDFKDETYQRNPKGHK